MARRPTHTRRPPACHSHSRPLAPTSRFPAHGESALSHMINGVHSCLTNYRRLKKRWGRVRCAALPATSLTLRRRAHAQATDFRAQSMDLRKSIAAALATVTNGAAPPGPLPARATLSTFGQTRDLPPLPPAMPTASRTQELFSAGSSSHDYMNVLSDLRYVPSKPQGRQRLTCVLCWCVESCS